MAEGSSKRSKKRQKKSQQSSRPNQVGPRSVSNQSESDNFSTLGTTSNSILGNSLPQKEMATVYKVVDIEGKGLGCVALTDIKRGALILNETPQMQSSGKTLYEASQNGRVTEWVKSLLKSFNQMNDAEQLEFMTLCNIYDFQELPFCKKRIITEMIVGEKSQEQDFVETLVKTINSQIDKIEKDPKKAEKILKICKTFVTNCYSSGVPMKTSRFNHSCRPNATPFSTPSGQNQIRAVKGQVISESNFAALNFLKHLQACI